MGSHKVKSPDGGDWVVRRRWMKWRPQWPWELQRKPRKDPDKAGLGWLDLLWLDELGLAILATVGVFLLIVFIILPAVVFVFQLVVFVAVLALSVFLRVLLRRPWTVEAVSVQPEGERRTWAVVGWRRSRRVIAEVGQGIALGHRFIEPEGARLTGPSADSDL
jgi:hypothetical protein